MNGCVALISLVLFFFCFFPPNFRELQPGKSRMTEVKRIDYGGLVLYMGGLICLLLALCKTTLPGTILTSTDSTQLGATSNIHGRVRQ